MNEEIQTLEGYKKKGELVILYHKKIKEKKLERALANSHVKKLEKAFNDLINSNAEKDLSLFNDIDRFLIDADDLIEY